MGKRWGRMKDEDELRSWLDEELEADAMDIGEFGFWYGYAEEPD